MSDLFSDRDIDVRLVSALIAEQFPRWAHLPIMRVEPGGWDNRTFRLGAAMSVRLPSAAGYAAQVEKEHRWLPHLAPHLPVPIPTPAEKGAPNEKYPWPWSIYGWIRGDAADRGAIDDLELFAADVAHFLSALQKVDTERGPRPGEHSAYRGGALTTYDDEARRAIQSIGDEFDEAALVTGWEVALASESNGRDVWVHGDVASGNLLERNGRLAGVIDFGCTTVGDPACDYAIAWTMFTAASRNTFREILRIDDSAWQRGRGWALWKAAITVAEMRASDPVKAEESKRILRELID